MIGTMTHKIKVLSDNVMKRIAAGEVVGRPASVVKELMENALDAEADVISLFIEGGGLETIQVSDNGVGMNEEDALICCEQHATSKIMHIQDIETIVTMGFRGEALASISSVVTQGGRIFYVLDEATSGSMQVPGRWILVARDAFSGVLLWKQQITTWAYENHGFRAGPVQLPRLLVAGPGRLAHRAARGVVGFEPPPLLDGIGQLGERVREFEAAGV